MGLPSTTSLFRTHTEPLNPSTPHVTQMTRRRGEKNGRVCLCQGLMKRVMPWIGCSVGSPQFPLVQSGPVMCDWRDITQPRLTGPRLPCQHALHPPNHAGMHCINEPTLFISLHFSFLKKNLFQANTHSSGCFFFLLQEHIFKLMKSDSYARFLRSNIYQDLLLARKKVSCTHWPLCHRFFFTKLCRSYCLYDLKTTPGSCLLLKAIMGCL